MKDYKTTANILNDGGVGLLPSDTIYGLSARALDQKAVQRIYELKGRSEDKPLIILLAGAGQGSLLGLGRESLGAALPFWPAPLTLIAEASQYTPRYLHRGANALAVRVPADESLRGLLEQTGPLVSTSANPAGRLPAETVQQAKDYFGDKLDFYFDAGPLRAGPSTIIKNSGGKPKVVRQGSFKIP